MTTDLVRAEIMEKRTKSVFLAKNTFSPKKHLKFAIRLISMLEKKESVNHVNSVNSANHVSGFERGATSIFSIEVFLEIHRF